MNKDLIKMLDELGIIADEFDDYGGYAVYGCTDGLLGNAEREFTDGTPEARESQKDAWQVGYDLGRRYREEHWAASIGEALAS